MVQVVIVVVGYKIGLSGRALVKLFFDMQYIRKRMDVGKCFALCVSCEMRSLCIFCFSGSVNFNKRCLVARWNH